MLQYASATDGASATADDAALDPEVVVAAAVDAGIAEAAVRRALAIEQLGPAPAGQRGDGLLGPAAVAVDDELAGSPGELLAALDDWLVNGHHLRRDRLRGGRGVWRRRTGVLGATFRTVRRVTGEGQLGDLARVEATAVDTGSGTCAVRVTADRRRERTLRAAFGAAVATAGTAVVTGVAVVTVPAVLLATPLAIGAGTGLAATGRRSANEVGDELARVLDAVGHGETPVRLGTDVVRRVIGRRPGRHGRRSPR